MTRSTRYTSICGNTCAKSDHAEKRFASRRERLAAKTLLLLGNDLVNVQKKITPKEWMAKDGKQWFDPDKHPQLMRK